MFLNKLEIKIALLGYVSVGKTTLLNAMLRDKFSEVSMLRTTAGVSFFRVSSGGNQTTKQGTEAEAKQDEWILMNEGAPRSAESTHEEIANDNAILRQVNMIQEKVFDVALDQPLCEMRKDTRLVLVDIPGINEADTGAVYKDYVASNWNTYDCVIVVMDAVQGVNTEEQVQLLKFVREQNETKKDVPVIILCNKVDDPEHEEQDFLLKQAREKVEEIFNVGCREDALEKVVFAATEGRRCSGPVSPTFFPISAMYAFMYRAASQCTLEEFKKFDKNLIDRLGREEVGRFRWKQLTQHEKYQTVYDVVSDPSMYLERLEATNFDTFLKVLNYFVGGEKVQKQLIEKQIQTSLGLLDVKTNVAAQLQSLYTKCTAVGRNADDLKASFWKAFFDCKDRALTLFRNDMKIGALYDPIRQVKSYKELIKHAGWADEGARIAREMEMYVRAQLNIIMEKENEWAFRDCNFFKHHSRSGEEESAILENKGWVDISPYDWRSIVASILLLSTDRHFNEAFGQEIILLGDLLSKYRAYLAPHHQLVEHQDACAAMQWYLKGKYTEGSFAPDDANHYDLVVSVKVPRSLSDPEHWGSVGWYFCKVLDELNTKA